MTAAAIDRKENSLSYLTTMIREQLEGIRDAYTTLTAGFNAMRRSDTVGVAIAMAASDLEVQLQPGDKPVSILDRIADKADSYGLDTKGLRCMLPAIYAIAAEAEKTRANGFQTVKIARQILRARKDATR